MSHNFNDQIALFIRDEKTGRYSFNAEALRALGVDPAEASDRGHPVKQPEESLPDLVA
jgi:hypothetical protein